MLVCGVAAPITSKATEKSELPLPPEKSQQMLTDALPGGNELPGSPKVEAVRRACGSHDPTVAALELKLSWAGSKLMLTSTPKRAGSRLGSTIVMVTFPPAAPDLPHNMHPVAPPP